MAQHFITESVSTPKSKKGVMGGYFDYLKRRQSPAQIRLVYFQNMIQTLSTEDNDCVHGWVTTLYESTQEVFLVNEKT